MKAAMCPYCMSESQGNICVSCGRDIHYSGHPNHLPVDYVLQGHHTYVLGASIGQGGFGITYIARDLDSNIRVAIKEYYPTHCCGRSNMTAVCPHMGQEDTFSKGKQQFLLEAQMLQSLSDLDCVVKVLDYFEANNAAYLVMEYLDGLSLKDHVEQRGKLPAQEFLTQMKLLMSDMEKMHQRGVVHRDIAPDNIIILPDGRLKLIDFGAARSYVGDKSMTVVVKKGFAPVEQYMRKGSNASTDVYALAATIYYCITGIVPPDSAERQYGEASLIAPTALGIELSWAQEKALEMALEIQPKDRTPSIAALMKDLYIPRNPTQSSRNTADPLPDIAKAAPAARNVQNSRHPVKTHSTRKKSHLKWLITAAAVAVCIGGILLNGPDKNEASVSAATTVAAPVVQTPPVVTIPSPVEAPMPARSNVLAPSGRVSDLHKFWGQEYYDKLQVKTVRFLDSLGGAPADAVDVSDAQDRSVLMWMNDGNLTVAANGQIAFNPNSSGMFNGFRNLEKIDFGNACDTSEVTNMSYMFQGCEKLTKLDLSGFDTSRVTDMNHMFYSCKNLKSLNVSDFHTGNVTRMDWMFTNCDAITALDLRNFDTSNVTSFLNMFYGCQFLTSLDVSSFNTSNATSFNSMFAYCRRLPSLDVSGFDTSKATDMDRMFTDMTNVTFLDVSHFDTSNVETMSNMFSFCHELTSLDVSHFDTSKVTSMYEMFAYCYELAALDVSSFDTSSVTSMYQMFGYCHKLAALDVSNFDTSNVTTMEMMFFKNTKLAELDVSHFDTSHVKDMSAMFSGCENLKALDVSGFDISNVTDMKGMFQNCPADIPGWYHD